MAFGGKLRRELDRLGRQVTGVGRRLAGGARRRAYDRARADAVRVTDGAVAALPEAAVLLIYQPAGVLGSTHATLARLAGAGIAPVVVSNAPLSDADRARLAAAAHLVIERPNVGYDFGGYREGVLTVLDRMGPLRALHVMNDSMWFPLSTGCDALARLGAGSADLTGLYLGCYSARQGRTYLQSYYYRFDGALAGAAWFRRYWETMPLIDHKHSVVRRFERRLTDDFRRRGASVDALVRWDDVIAHLLALDDAALALYLEHQCAVTPAERARCAALPDRLRDPRGWRLGVDDLVRRRRVFVNLTEMHPRLLAELGVPFLKKARSPACRRQRAILAEGGAPLDPALRAEIAAWDDQSSASQRP